MLRRFSAALLLAVLAAAGPALAATAIHRTSGAEPPSLDPTTGSATLAAPILSDLVEGLLSRTPTATPAPGCAESWSVSDDRLTWTFRLREGLKWSDGTPLTAEDFAWSFRRLIDPASAAPSAGLFFIIKNARAVAQGKAAPEALGVRAPDARTLEIQLEFPAPYLPQLLANTQSVPVPRHVIEKLGRDWTRPGAMVTNGPYVLAEREPQNWVKLTRNPHYFDADQVKIDEVYWYPTQDMGAAFRRFRAGELDMVLNLAPDDARWAAENIPDRLRGGPMHATYTLLFNTTRKPFDDVRVRRALSLAIDRDAIANQLLRTGVRPAWTWVSPGIGDYPGIPSADAKLKPAERKARARALLKEAGFGPDNPLVVPVTYDTNEENRKILVGIAAMWQAVGVRAELANVEFRAVMGQLRARNFGVARSSTFSLYGDPYAFLQQLSGRAPNNWTGWNNPRYDQLLQQGNAAADPAERYRLLAEAEALVSAEQPLVPIYHYHGKLLLSSRVKGWWDAAIGTPPSRWLSVTE